MAGKKSKYGAKMVCKTYTGENSKYAAKGTMGMKTKMVLKLVVLKRPLK